MSQSIRQSPEGAATDVGPRETPLHGQRVVLAGRFATMSQREVADLIRQAGGEVLSRVSRAMTILVVGQGGDDTDEPRLVEQVRHLAASGYTIKIVDEQTLVDEWLAAPRPVRRYTLAQISRILGISGQRLRNWMRAGLLKPVAIEHRLAWFDFGQLTLARSLKEWTDAGFSLQRLSSSPQWSHLLDDRQNAVTAWRVDGSQIVARRADGVLVQTNGQTVLDFDLSTAPQIVSIGPGQSDTDSEESSRRDRIALPFEGPKTADECFDIAVANEMAGQYADAAAAYLRAIELEPRDPVLYFNVGNVLYLLGDTVEAAWCFEQAVQLDGQYVEALNNWGSVLAELGQHEQAIDALRRAIAIVPSYADAHFNLAETLDELGRHAEADRHWQTYLQWETTGPWAERAAGRLASR